MTFHSVEEKETNMLHVVITWPGPEFSFRTRYPIRSEFCHSTPSEGVAWALEVMKVIFELSTHENPYMDSLGLIYEL